MDPEEPRERRPGDTPLEPAEAHPAADPTPVLGEPYLEAEAEAADSPEVVAGEEPQGERVAGAHEATSARLAEGEAAPARRWPFGLSRKHAVVAGACVVVLVLLLGVASLWRAHNELGTLRREIDALKSQTRRAQVAQGLASVLRVRAELQGLRQTLPPELSAEVDKVEGTLTGLDDRLKASQ